MTYIAVYHENGADWSGPSGSWNSDRRAPLSGPGGPPKIWAFNVWNTPELPAEATFVKLFWRELPDPDLRLTLTLVQKPAGITAGPGIGTVWDLSQTPQDSIILTPFRTTNGHDGYLFQFAATIIPEPSSLFALGAGAAGLVGLMRRRC